MAPCTSKPAWLTPRMIELTTLTILHEEEMCFAADDDKEQLGCDIHWNTRPAQLEVLKRELVLKMGDEACCANILVGYP